jgi:hypothetical protein
MISTAKRGSVLLTAVLAVVASGFGAGRAEAQWGGGFGGMGIGFYGGGLIPYVQQPGNYLNQVALAQMNHVRGPMQNNVYTSTPNSYVYHIRDNDFVDRYYPDRREPAYYGYRARPRVQRATPTAMNVAPSRPLVPLTSFFNDKGQFVWPADSPMAGDLKDKREAFDKTCRAVLDEVKKNGVAAIASVTEARQKLLEYGRPALQSVKAHDTPRVADSFHGFLLMLYDSLAEATNPPSPS